MYRGAGGTRALATRKGRTPIHTLEHWQGQGPELLRTRADTHAGCPNPTIAGVAAIMSAWVTREPASQKRRLCGIGGNHEAARLAGLQRVRLRVSAFAATGLAIARRASSGCATVGSDGVAFGSRSAMSARRGAQPQVPGVGGRGAGTPAGEGSGRGRRRGAFNQPCALARAPGSLERLLRRGPKHSA